MEIAAAEEELMAPAMSRTGRVSLHDGPHAGPQSPKYTFLRTVGLAGGLRKNP